MAVLVAGSLALMNLYRVACPLNRLRAILVGAMAGLFALAFVVPWGRDLFELPTAQPWVYAVAAIIIAIGYPLLVLGSWLSERISAANDARRAASAPVR